MSDCQTWQQEMDELLALGGTPEEFSDEMSSHLASCQVCRDFCQESLELNRMMDEPLALPPADLVENVMARIAHADVPEPKLPWAERFAWAISGAVAMYCAERIPEYSSGWLTGMEQIFLQTDSLLQMPMAISATTVALAACSLFVVQGALVYRTRALV